MSHNQLADDILTLDADDVRLPEKRTVELVVRRDDGTRASVQRSLVDPELVQALTFTANGLAG